MPPSRRDFMKGLAAIAASIPVLGTTQCVVQSGPPDEPEESSIDLTPGGQPEFYVLSYDIEHVCDVVTAHELGRTRKTLRTVSRQESDEIHLELYTEHPVALSAWCENNPLTVELEHLGKTLEVRVRKWDLAMPGVNRDVVVSVDGTVMT